MSTANLRVILQNMWVVFWQKRDDVYARQTSPLTEEIRVSN
ncbi:MAG: hypothetical protein ABGX33_02520 [Cycloclasticus sp.]